MRWGWIVATGLLLAGCAEELRAEYLPVSSETLAPAVASAAQVAVLASVPADKPHTVIGQVMLKVRQNHSAKEAIIQELRRRAWQAGGQALVNLQVDTSTEWVQNMVYAPNTTVQAGQTGQSGFVNQTQQQTFIKASATVIRYAK